MTSDMLINANDRQIRYFRLEESTGVPILHNKFQDLVNRIQWSQSCFSSDGEFVIGGSGHKAEHNIYIWDKNMGNLVKILEGPKEPLDDLAVSWECTCIDDRATDLTWIVASCQTDYRFRQ